MAAPFCSTRYPLLTQKELPLFDASGKICLSSEKDLFIFSNGAGGVFPSMKSGQIFDHL